MTLRVKLRGPDGTLSGEITRVVPSAEIAPDWLPTSITSVGSNVPVPHKLVVGSAAILAFEFATNGDLSSSNISQFTMYVDGTLVSLAGATVSGRTLSVSYAAVNIASRTFEFRARGSSVSAVVGASEVYAFPSVVSTAKGTPVVTLGSSVTLTTTFGAALPVLMTASMIITPAGYDSSTLAVTPSASEATTSYTVVYDVAHSALVSLVYGPATQEYAWSTSALTASEIYTFPSSFAVSGWLHQLTPRQITLPFSGGDLLHSSVVASQVAYVKYMQGAAETTIADSGISCSAPTATITLGSLAPAALVDVVLKVALRAPDGAIGPELTRTIPGSAIAPQWVPTAAGSIASNVLAPYKLAVGSDVQLTFSLVAGADFPSTNASALFTLRVDGAITTLAGAVVNTTARTVRVAYTAASAVAVAFEFSTSYGTSYAFAVSAAEVYTFPTMSSTTRGVSVVTLGQTLALTSLFSAAPPSGTTAAVSIVPTGYAAVTPVASVSGSSVAYSLSVAYDVLHTGTVTLTYGAAQRAYTWAAGTLTAAHIYTFPSAFTYDGTGNGYGTGTHLKEGTAGALTLTFVGGDMLHSSVLSTQISYVKFAQSSVETTISSASLACSDPLETVTVSSITPASTAALTLTVRLRGPDGALSSEITAVVPSAQIAVSVQPLLSSGLVLDIRASSYVSGSTISNAVSGGTAASLKGSYSAVTLGGRQGIHLANTSPIESSNISAMLLPSVAYNTISMWIRFPSSQPNASWAFVLDGRVNGSYGSTVNNGTLMNPPGAYPHFFGDQYAPYDSSYFNNAFFHNGGTAQNIRTYFVSNVMSVTDVWHHVTFVLRYPELVAPGRFTVCSDASGLRGCNAIIGRVSVYNTALTQAQNYANYAAGF